MSRYQPPYTITPTILNRVAEISELLGQWSAQQGELPPHLKRKNRIRTIQASLAIENNTLSIGQVTDIVEGKRILGLPREVQEVKNALTAYEQLPHWQSTRAEDILTAHGLLMQGLTEDAGLWRTKGVGVFRGKTLLHMAPPASQIPRLMADLLNWLATTDIHPLIAGSVFHYEFEFIHPFSDGNGRLGRLWQTLILSQWRSQMAFLPVESVIRDHQERYYPALGQADQQSDCTGFIELMLSLLAQALAAGIPSFSPTLFPTHMSEMMSEKGADKNIQAILTALEQTPKMTIGQLAVLLNVSTRTIERHLKSLQKNGQLKRIGPPRGGHWQVQASPPEDPQESHNKI